MKVDLTKCFHFEQLHGREGDYQHKILTTGKSSIEIMDTIAPVGDTIRSSVEAPNQVSDLYGTNENISEVLAYYRANFSDPTFDEIRAMPCNTYEESNEQDRAILQAYYNSSQVAEHYQVAQCAEFTAIGMFKTHQELMARNISTPIFHMRLPSYQGDRNPVEFGPHHMLWFGDRRMLPDSEIPFLDTWAPFGQVGVLTEMDEEEKLENWIPVCSINSNQPISCTPHSENLDRFLHFKKSKISDDDRLETIERKRETPGWLFSELSAVKDISTRYRPEGDISSGKAYCFADTKTVTRYEQGMKRKIEAESPSRPLTPPPSKSHVQAMIKNFLGSNKIVKTENLVLQNNGTPRYQRGRGLRKQMVRGAEAAHYHGIATEHSYISYPSADEAGESMREHNAELARSGALGLQVVDSNDKGSTEHYRLNINTFPVEMLVKSCIAPHSDGTDRTIVTEAIYHRQNAS